MASIYESFLIQNVSTKGPLTLNDWSAQIEQTDLFTVQIEAVFVDLEIHHYDLVVPFLVYGSVEHVSVEQIVVYAANNLHRTIHDQIHYLTERSTC